MAVQIEQDIGSALGFDADDLAANRDGRLSDGQKQRLSRTRRRTLLTLLALLIGVGLAAAALLFAGQRSGSSVAAFIGAALTACNAGFSAVMARNWLRLGADVDAGQVTVVSGTLKHTIRITGRIVTYVLEIGGEEFVVAKPLFFALKEGEAYRFYRAPLSRALLAID